jgi:RHS repeat-associated protein
VDTFKYDPYGNLTNTTGSLYEPIRFAGGFYDIQTGLYHFGQRYYDSQSGRWTQQDPADDPLSLNGWNRFVYAGDDPINNVDPSGMLHRGGDQCGRASGRALQRCAAIYWLYTDYCAAYRNAPSCNFHYNERQFFSCVFFGVFVVSGVGDAVEVTRGVRVAARMRLWDPKRLARLTRLGTTAGISAVAASLTGSCYK